MKELIKTIKQTWKMETTNIWFAIPIAVISYVVGIVIVVMMMKMEEPGAEYAHVGSLFALMFSAIVLFFVGIIKFPSDFNLALSMGKVRKYLMISNYLVWTLSTLCILVFSMLGSLFEEWVYGRLYPGAGCEISIISFLGKPSIFLAILIFVPAIVILTGATYMKFGNKAMWVFWGVYMVLMALITKASDHPDSFVAKTAMKLFEVLAKQNTIPLICLGLSVFFLLLANLMLRKQRVTY